MNKNVVRLYKSPLLVLYCYRLPFIAVLLPHLDGFYLTDLFMPAVALLSERWFFIYDIKRSDDTYIAIIYGYIAICCMERPVSPDTGVI